MAETIVHVTTLDQWKSVLDVWFKQGYKWSNGDTGYNYFEDFDEDSGHSYLALEREAIFYSRHKMGSPIEYSEFMAQQKEDNKMETYYVTQGQLEFIKTIYDAGYSLDELLDNHVEAKNMFDEFSISKGKAVLRYLGGDTSIQFKVKEQLYRLWRIDDDGDKVYMRFSYGTPGWAMSKENAFTAPLAEIRSWQTPAWEIEEVN